MSRDFFPSTLKGYSMHQQGIDDETVAEYERARLTLMGAEGEAGLVQRHPECARPEVRAQVNAVIASDPYRYVRLAESGSPVDAYEAAYARAREQAQQPAPGTAPGAAAPRAGTPSYRPGIDPERLDQIRGPRGVDWHGAQQALSGHPLLHHPELDIDPRR